MKGRRDMGLVGNNSGGVATDLFICFPRGGHLALMPPKPAASSSIHSPSRQSSDRPAAAISSAIIRRPPNTTTTTMIHGKSPLFRARSASSRRTKSVSIPTHHEQLDDEPTSPKVTCAGQVKVRHSKTPRQSISSVDVNSWRSAVVEEIERIHTKQMGNYDSKSKRKKKEKKKKNKNKSSSWLETLGLKREFLSVIHGFRFNMRCFGSFYHGDCSTDQDDEDVEEEEEEKEEPDRPKLGSGEISGRREPFSKLFMVLEQQSSNSDSKIDAAAAESEGLLEDRRVVEIAAPKNALVLMRCRSAPAEGCLPRFGEEQVTICEPQGRDEKPPRAEDSKEEMEKDDNMVILRYAPDFFKVSMDIAKETWVVGSGGEDLLPRCRSWKR